jgi:uncharacterized damage-inducible protein DinB
MKTITRPLFITAMLIALFTPVTTVLAQENPYSNFTRAMYGPLKQMVLQSADKVPEEHYGFKPTDAVRSYGQILGHIADSQYTFCSIVLGEKNPLPKIEKTKSTKADLIAALKESFAYCDRAYNAITDASGAEMTKFRGMNAPKLGILSVNTTHSTEHYGNLVTYMRLKNIVPPTSDPEFMKQFMPAK